MSSAAVRLFGVWALLLAVQAVHGVTVSQQVQSLSLSARGEATTAKKATAPDSNNAFMKMQDESEDELHDPNRIYGKPGHYWHWVKDAKLGWKRENVADGAVPAPAKALKANVTAAAKKSNGKMVNIDVYYETRCPGCLLFINKTLEPLWRNKGIQGVLNITMYTYGNGMTIPTANVSEGYKFWHPETTGKGWDEIQICQHGSDECLGNLVQVCAKDIADHAKYMELIFCMTATTIGGYGVEKSSYECMQKNGIDYDKVKECVTSPRGNELMTELGRQTHLLKSRKGTPWVMVAGAHVDTKLLLNTTLLTQAVCSHVDNVPPACAPWDKTTKKAPEKKTGITQGPDFQVFQDMELAEVSRDYV